MCTLVNKEINEDGKKKLARLKGTISLQFHSIILYTLGRFSHLFSETIYMESLSSSSCQKFSTGQVVRFIVRFSLSSLDLPTDHGTGCGLV